MSDTTDRLADALSDRYTIERELGAGGMATVYLAEDLKHDRKVALKVLRPELAAVLGADRFVQEIKTTAALQHPHILPLFDSGEADGFLYYVMPYVEGETLREKLDRETQLGIDEAVKITVEVADALQYAHEQGVIHRDIKPENILLHAGRPMVADFGIALALSAAAGGRMTETGMSLGTPHYMSPEQATADKDITGRSDIYSLASVLYEMLTGNPPHVGSSAQQIIMKIIAEDVKPVTAFRKSVPANVAAATAKALEKLPADRFASAKAFAEALTNPSYTAPSAPSAAPAALQRSRITTYALGAACLVLAAAALWGWLRPTLTPSESREHIELGTLAAPGTAALGAAIAPDGSAIVYPDTVGGSRRLWIKERDALQARPLAPLPRPGIPPGPSFSPDGQWITYVDGKLKKVARQGGSPIQLSDSGASFGAAWLDDGAIVFIGPNGNSLLTVPSGGGPARHVLTVNDVMPGASIIKVTAVPGKTAALFTLAQNTPKVFALDLKTDSVHALETDAGDAWVVLGRLLYVTHTGQLLSVPFDARHLTTHGAPTSIIQGIRTTQGLGDATVGRDGTLLYFSGQAVPIQGNAGIVSVARNGRATPLDTAWKAAVPNNGAVALSPDGRRLALTVVDSATGSSNIFVVRLASGIATRLTFGGTVNVRPWWSTDGTTLLYVSNSGGTYGLWTKRADGSGHATPVKLPETRPIWEGIWSPDGRWLVYRTDNAAMGNGDILAVKTGGDTTPVSLAATDAQEVGPVISPDGHWVAYTSDASGQLEVYVRPFPNASGGGMWQVSTDGGSEARWSHSGRDLYYRNGAGDLVAVAVSETPTFTPGAHTTLFNTQAYVSDNISHYYAVTPDDEHFIFLRRFAAGPGARGSLVLMRNWMENAAQ